MKTSVILKINLFLVFGEEVIPGIKYTKAYLALQLESAG